MCIGDGVVMFGLASESSAGVPLDAGCEELSYIYFSICMACGTVITSALTGPAAARLAESADGFAASMITLRRVPMPSKMPENSPGSDDTKSASSFGGVAVLA